MPRNYKLKHTVPFRTARGISGRAPNTEQNLPKRIARVLFKHKACFERSAVATGYCKHTHELSVADIILLCKNGMYILRRAYELVDGMERERERRELKGKGLEFVARIGRR